MKHIRILLASVCLAFTSCNENLEDGTFDESFTPQSYDVKGKVEKGPFISGSQISIQPTDAKLQVLGTVFNISIVDDLGSFVLGNKEFSSPYAELIASGYFFNEINGELSKGTLTLKALVNLDDNSTVNVNILTHLKYLRIKKLVASGKRFDDANSQAQKELLEAFGLGKYDNNDVSSFSIIAGTDESAALIAISSLLLMDRTEAELTEYLAKLSADFEKHGKFSNEIKSQIASDTKDLANRLETVRNNIIQRYEYLGISVDVKDLSHFIDWNNDGIAGNELLKDNEEIIIENPSIEVPNEGGEFTIEIKSPISVYLESQVDEYLTDLPTNSISPEESFLNGLYDVNSSYKDEEISCECNIKNNILYLKISALQSRIDKSRSIPLYDYLGNVVATIELKQEGRIVDVPTSEIPLLGEDGRMAIASVAMTMTTGLANYNLIEQYYNYNKYTNYVRYNITPYNNEVYQSWRNIYSAIQKVLYIQDIDKRNLNVYDDYFNILKALLYSNLVYGWDAVPYYTKSISDDLSGIKQESSQMIFKDLKSNLLKAIDNLPEKKNESLKDINGFFFVSKDVARVLLANIYMYEGNYKDALPLLDKVVNNGFYSFDASTNFQGDVNIEISRANNIQSSESTEIIYGLMNDAGTRSDVSFTIAMPKAIPYITLSDVYLSLAECHYKLEESATAEQYVKSVVDVKKLNILESNILMQIKEVREQILLYSGTYFAFLKRTGIAKDICQIEDYQLLLPITIQEIEMSKDMIQNLGY